MTTTLRVLLVEDNEDDVFLITRALRRGGLNVDIERVQTRDAYNAALNRGQFDIVLSDYVLPSFDGMEALAILRARPSSMPFILLSGTVGEEIAVQSIHAGADDYLLKQNLVRLVPAIHRALREASRRQQQEAAEKALAKSRERLELIFNSVSDILVFLSLDESDRWQYREVNRAGLMKLREVGLHLSADDLLGREASYVEAELLNVDDKSVLWLNAMRNQVRSERTAHTVERTFDFPAGTYTAEFSFMPALDSNGDTRHILMGVRDVTAQRRAEQHERQLREKVNHVQRLESLGTLASGVAHDFNNLLTGIMGFAELANHAHDSAEAKQHCAQIVQISQQARDLIRRILVFGRPVPTKDGSIPFCDSVRELVSLVRLSCPNNVLVAVQIANSDAHVRLDMDQLLQVLLNLVTNANHAMPQGGQLTIAGEIVQIAEPMPADLYPLQPGQHAKLVVADTGSGIPADVLPKIFDPFFTTKPMGEGTGIGLAMVDQIVRSCHGTIRVTSVAQQGAPQQGATFEIYFPVVDQSDSPAAQDKCSDTVPDDEHSLASLEAEKGRLTADLTKIEKEKEKAAALAAELTAALAKTKSELKNLFEQIGAMRNEILEVQARITARRDPH